MRALPIVTAVAAVVLLAGCAQPAADPTEAPTTAPTSQAPAPTSESSAAPTPTETDPQAVWQRIETPNGTASFRIPPGWSAEVDGEEQEYDGETHWVNGIAIRDPDGSVRLSYWDGPGDGAGAVARFGIVSTERVATLSEDELAAVDRDDRSVLEHSASAWWDGNDTGDTWAHVALSHVAGGDQPPTATVIDGERLIDFSTRRDMASEEEAIAWLESAEAALLLDIIATLDLTGIPAPVLPEG
ncbi:hypothetical protein OVA14_03040 [Agrococcus sp. SL85]|uniref:hypothetical protein n=1 Tax=Agrococcus sp. SL85 TaxID=2995141 RepID=UPI00226D2932|nr:hypothetical protein [Agrococcus sp. SL85]WAC66766.1 hypothetical protein OVA14_03040 [Agrococcus sp. SL85]